MREIKFRAWDKVNKRMGHFESGFQWHDEYNLWHLSQVSAEYDKQITDVPCEDNIILMQFTGLLDKNKKEIYEGDIIRKRTPYRTTQTHTGDNIPRGSYTEPMEPGIKTEEGEVEFREGTFYLNLDDDYDPVTPLSWHQQQWDEQSTREAIQYRRDGSDMWDDPEEGDLNYLLTEYKLKDLDALIEHLSGLEVVGNIFESNPAFPSK